MYKLSILFLVFISFKLCAQTKLIAHKSHSGTEAGFFAALKDGLYDNSNFGMAPQRTVTFAQLDSVIFVSDSVAVMVTSTYCGRSFDSEPATLWSAGKDTVVNHPLFSMQHDLDSIKKALKSRYFFRNRVDSVKFIGYDNNNKQLRRQQTRQQEQDETLPLLNPMDGNGPEPQA